MRNTGIPWVGRPAKLWPVVALLVVLIVAIQLVRDRRYEAYRAALEVLYIPSGTALQRIALSFDALLADVYWIRAIQYYGGAKLADDAERNYALLYPLLDITTTLDPRFNVAYRFGAIFLTEAYPDGPGQPDAAVALLEKGARYMPERWEYLQDIGFVHYWWLHDYETAAQWFRRASEIPGAAWWLESLAANTLAVGGNRGGSRRLWQQMHETADNDWMRVETERRLLQLDALDQIDSYTLVAEAFAAREGRWPASWQDIAAPGSTSAAPLDPTGHPYLMDLRAGAVTISPQSPLFPLPDEPPGATPR